MFKISLKHSAISKIVAVLVVVAVIMPNALLISTARAEEGGDAAVASSSSSDSSESDSPADSGSTSDESSSTSASDNSSSEESADASTPSEDTTHEGDVVSDSATSNDTATDDTTAQDQTISTDNTSTDSSTANNEPKSDAASDTTEVIAETDSPVVVTTDTTDNSGGSSNGGGEIAAVGAPVTGSIRVCYLTIDENDNVVTDANNLPAARFSINLTDASNTSVGNTTFDTTLFAANTTVLTTSSTHDAECVTYSNLPANDTHYTYGQQTISGPSTGLWETARYSDHLGLHTYTILGSFVEFNTDDVNADGDIVLTQAVPNRTLIVLNQFTPATTGSIKVCVMYADQNGNIAQNAAGLPEGTFAVSLIHANGLGDVGIPMFTAAGFTPNTSVIGSNDAECTTYTGLPLDAEGYYYSEEKITEPVAGTWTPKYDDLVFVHVRTILQSFYDFSGELFDADSSNDDDRNVDADGHIILTGARPERTLVILNQFGSQTEPCVNGVLTPAGFTDARNNGDITFSFDAVETGSTTATFHVTNNTGCTAPISLTSYKIFDNEMENWQIFDNSGVVNVSTSSDLTVNLPNCMSMIYAWYGQGVSSFTVDQQQAYYSDTTRNPHIFDKARHYSTGPFCEQTNNAPVITILGDNPLRVTVGDNFTDPGATALDAEEGDITNRITASSTVDANTVGTYTITYRVSDTPGLTDEETRTVIVERERNGGGGGGGSSGGSRRGGSSGGRGGSVLGEEIGPTTCPYLNDYLHINWNNNPTEVLKLQYFLKFYAGQSQLEATGIFDQATFNAVSAFQTQYMADVLSPWGHDKATGYVYILTKKKINEIMCNTTIALTDTQADEIAQFRTLLAGLQPGNGSVDTGALPIGNDIKDISDVVGTAAPTSGPVVAVFGENGDGINTENIKAIASAIWSIPKDRGMLLQSLYFLLIAIIAIYLATEIVVGSMNTASLGKYKIWARKATGYIIGLVLAIIVAIWYKVFSIVIPLIVLLIVAGAFLASAMTKRNGDQVISVPPNQK